MAGVNKLLKEAQKMQAKLQTMQTELAQKPFEASMAGGAVVATVNGAGEIQSLKLDAEFLKENTTEVQNTIVSAIKQAQADAKKSSDEQMAALTGPMQSIFG